MARFYSEGQCGRVRVGLSWPQSGKDKAEVSRITIALKRNPTETRLVAGHGASPRFCASLRA